MNHEEAKRRLLGNREVREAYENPPLPLATARTVVERRKELGITQKELADRLDSSQAQVWRIESGHFNPTLKTLSRLEKALGIELIPAGGAPEGDLEPTASDEQLEEWIELGLVVMGSGSRQVALENMNEDELARLVKRLQSVVNGLEEGEYVEVTLKPTGEPAKKVELSLTV